MRIKESIITTGCAVICGSSAAAALKTSLNGREKDSRNAIIISALTTIPCIILLPIIAGAFDVPVDVAGSWFGGSIDNAGAVLATAN